MKTQIYVPSRQKGWILDRLALDLQTLTNGRIIKVPVLRREVFLFLKYIFRPRSKNLIFLHHNLFINMFGNSTASDNCKTSVFFTHHSNLDPSELSRLKSLALASKIVVCSTEIKNFLLSNIGNHIDQKIMPKVGGADLSYFSNLNLHRNPKSVIMVSKYSGRKRPDLILRTVQTNPDFSFLLHGKGWVGTDIHAKLIGYSNFIYSEFDFAKANLLFNSSFTFLSLSDVEGAPMPALEALASGCRVVLTNTGFATDLEAMSFSVKKIQVNPSEEQVRNSLLESLTMPSPAPALRESISYESFLKEFVLS